MQHIFCLSVISKIKTKKQNIKGEDVPKLPSGRDYISYPISHQLCKHVTAVRISRGLYYETILIYPV